MRTYSQKTLDGRFFLEERLGTDGAGDIYSGRDVETNEKVIVKLLKPQSAESNNLLSRRLQEFKVLHTLNHPNAIRVIHAGLTSDNIFYVAMENVASQTLAQVVEKTGPIAVTRVADFLEQVASVLEIAHTRMIVHRDIKPNNLLLSISADGREVIKLDGFVFARILAEEGGATKLTQAGSAVGTPEYMSPEQALGRKATKQSDIYSLGATVYTLLTGVLPFEARSDVDFMVAHVQTPVPTMSERNPRVRVPGSVETVIRKAMSKEPVDRFRSAGEMARAFREAVLAAGETMATPAPTWAPAPESGPLPEISKDLVSTAPSTSQGSNGDFTALIVLVVCAAAIGLGLLLGKFLNR